MEINQLIQTLLGTLIGGSIVIASNWISAQIKQRKAAQEWYERTYLTQGLDPLITYLLNLRLHVLNADINNSMKLPDIGSVPVDALARTQLLLNDTVINGIIVLIHASLASSENEKRVAASFAALKVSNLLLELRHELLHTIWLRLKSKSYQLNATHVRSKLKVIFDELYENNPTIVSWQVARARMSEVGQFKSSDSTPLSEA